MYESIGRMLVVFTDTAVFWVGKVGWDTGFVVRVRSGVILWLVLDSTGSCLHPVLGYIPGVSYSLTPRAMSCAHVYNPMAMS